MEFDPEYCLVATSFIACFGIVAFVAFHRPRRLRAASFFLAVGMMIIGIGPALGVLQTISEYLALAGGIGTGLAFHRNRPRGVIVFVLGAMLVEALLPLTSGADAGDRQISRMLFLAYSAGWVAAAAGWDLTMVGWRMAGEFKQKASQQR